MPCLSRFALVLCGSLAAVAPAQANWTSDPAVGLAVCSFTGDQNMVATLADGYGGAWVAWSDWRGGAPAADIFMQHILAAGIVDPTWPENGLVVCDALHPQYEPALAPDGADGVYVTWYDTRVSATNADTYIQHVLASGAVDPTWPQNGAPVSTDLGQESFAIIMADGTGGAFVCTSTTSINPVVRVHHVLATGAQDPAWTPFGVRLSLTNYSQRRSAMIPDGDGGLIVAWDDERNGAGDIYAMHVLGSGALDPAWPVNGAALCTATGTQISVSLVGDGAGGAIAAWSDQRISSLGDAYAQHVLVNGVVDPAWPANGRAVCDAAGEQNGCQLVSDGAHGAVVTWLDKRSGNYDVYARRVLADGTFPPGAIPNGAVLCSAAGDQGYGASNNPMLPDGAGGAYLVWHDARTGDPNKDIYAMHVLQAGTPDPAWPVNGLAVSTAAGNQVGPNPTPDGSGGLLVAWSDNRGGTDYDVYAQRIAANGTLPLVGAGRNGPRPGARLEPPRPNPARLRAELRYSLAEASTVRLEILDLSGRRARQLDCGTRPAGPHEIRWDLRDDAGQLVANGLYFARLVVSGRPFLQRVVLLR
jgi:hypothetical protein